MRHPHTKIPSSSAVVRVRLDALLRDIAGFQHLCTRLTERGFWQHADGSVCSKHSRFQSQKPAEALSLLAGAKVYLQGEAAQSTSTEKGLVTAVDREMPRTLLWASSGQAKNPKRTPTPPPAPDRSSPPESPLQAPPTPPDVEYMREGYDADDIYRMVEDEFESTARMFTQHVHYAEYERIRANQRLASTPPQPPMPTDTTDRRPRRPSEISTASEMESDSEDEYKRVPELERLMKAARPEPAPTFPNHPKPKMRTVRKKPGAASPTSDASGPKSPEVSSRGSVQVIDGEVRQTEETPAADNTGRHAEVSRATETEREEEEREVLRRPAEDEDSDEEMEL